MIITCFAYSVESENNGGNDMNQDEQTAQELNTQEIMHHIELEEFRAKGMAEHMHSLGIGKILTLSVKEQGEWGWVLQFADDMDQVYYMVVTEYGGIDLLREGGSDGKVIYFMRYD